MKKSQIDSFFARHPGYQLERINVHTHHGCNLSCFGCNHHSALLAAGCSIDTDALVEDLELFLSRVRVHRVHVLGGEPLLNPVGTEKVCRFLVGRVELRLVTNGMLLHENGDWVADLVEKGMSLSISLQLDPRASSQGRLNARRIKAFLENTRAPAARIRMASPYRERWFSPVVWRGDKVHPHDGDAVESFHACVGLCPQLFGARVYKCAHIAYLRDLLATTGQLRDEECWCNVASVTERESSVTVAIWIRRAKRAGRRGSRGRRLITCGKAVESMSTTQLLLQRA